MTQVPDQWGRKATLILANDKDGLDLSQLHFTFNVRQADFTSPNNATIRVFNVNPQTIQKVKKEYSRVVLQAGYENGAFGIIFDGTVKYFHQGKVDATTTYFDIMAADGDIGYNFGIVSMSLAAGSTNADAINAASNAMGAGNAAYLQGDGLQATGGVKPRGKVLFGMARKVLTDNSGAIGSSWSIQNGKIQVIPLKGYLPNQAVVLNSGTGLIGIPEQTDNGVTCRCLLNPKIVVGGLIQINNADINKSFASAKSGIPGVPSAVLPHDSYGAPVLLADVSTDGFYRVLVSEYSGDTRGQAWYNDIIALAVDHSNNQVIANQ